MSHQRTVTIHMVASLDGMVAKTDNSVSWFETSCEYDKGVEWPDQDEYLRQIDCYIMGSNTYELALELSVDHGWVYGDKPTFVLTQRQLQSDRKSITFYHDDVETLIARDMSPDYQNIWVVGGPAIVKSILEKRLADEIRLNILPIILGDGLLFFLHGVPCQQLELINSTAYKNGMLELHYRIMK